VKVVQQTPDAATLQVSTKAGPAGAVKLVREEGRWKIHLDALDAPAPGPAPDAGPPTRPGPAPDAGSAPDAGVR
jgi:hypothetical protein